MTITITPKFTSSLPDNAAALAAGKVTPSRWNLGSAITMASGYILGRSSSSTGAVEELTPAAARTLLSVSSAADVAAKITGPSSATDNNPVVFDGTTGKLAKEISYAQFRTNANLVIGTDVQAWNARLDTLAGLAVTDGNIIVGDGTTWVAESGATARTSLGLGTGDSPQFTAINLGHATDTTITRVSAGVIAVEGSNVLLASGIGTSVQAYSARLTDIAALSVTDSNIIVGNGTTWVAETGATARTSLGLGTGDSPQFTAINLGHASDTTIARASAGVVTIEGVTVATASNTLTMTGKTIEAGTFTNGYTEEAYTANTGTSLTIDLANGSLQILTLTGNCTYTFPTATVGRSFTLLQLQDGTGGRTVTWPAEVKWPSSTAPTLTATASKADMFAFTADGTNWIARVVGQVYL